MNFFVLVSFSLLLAASSNPSHIIRQPKEIIQRRQYLGYSNNILHENPNFPEQPAQSNVKVNFNSNQPEQRKIYVKNPAPYQNAELSQPYSQNYVTDRPQSQLFNVGYSVSFTGDTNRQPKPPPAPKYPRSGTLDEAEIITGTRKRNEQVEIPPIHMSPQEYVASALIGNKKQKISGIKPKLHYVSYQNPKLLLAQANLSPNTQKFYKTIEQFKPQVQNSQELQQKYSWRNLSPGVEIIRSTEVPTAQKYLRAESSLHFDHVKALGRSQDFDHSNAVDSSNPSQQNALYYNNLRKPQGEKLVQNQQIPVGINQNIASLPIDTSLLRDPVPIQVDTRFIDEATRNQLAQYQQTPQEVNYLQQAYKTIPVQEATQNKPVQIIYEQDQTQVFPDQNRFQFKIYGKPQPLTPAYNRDEQLKRQPRFLTDLNTDLRPPPFDISYQRRILLG